MFRRILLSLALSGPLLHAQSQPPALREQGIDFVLIKAGTFIQGSPAGEAGRENDEIQRSVTLSQDYYMSAKPVSVGSFDAFVRETHYRTEAERGPSGGFGVENGKLAQRKAFTWRNPGYPQTDEHPVVIVTWNDAQAFCQWLTKKINREVALPSEAQWEYACRAGTTGARYAEPLDAVAWHRGNSDGIASVLGAKQANAWGLHDCYGPVWQWCEDFYAPYGEGNVTDPKQLLAPSGDKPRRVLRGGSFLSDASHSRSAERYRADAQSRNADNGFRVICSIAKTAVTPASKPVVVERMPSTPSSQIVHSPSVSQPHNFSPPATRQSGSSWLFRILFFGILFVVLFAVILKTVGGFGRSSLSRGLVGSTGGGPGLYRTTMKEDGFCLHAPADMIGRALAYSYILNGATHRDEVIYNPGPEGHFIFTGQPPQTVTMHTASDPASLGAAPIFMSNDDDDDRRRRWSSSSSSTSRSSHPPAY